jgi:hypothetical protein
VLDGAEPVFSDAVVSIGRPRVSVVIPCLNEAESIARCVSLALASLRDDQIRGEIIVVDNGSDDGSGALARAAGAIVVEEPARGYGNAYLAGFAAARGEYVVMVDADLTYHLGDVGRFVRELDNGAELVMGDRMDNIQPGAMPWLNRHVGNPLLSGFLNVLFATGVRDVHCGMRAVRRDVLLRLDLRADGMEFASEMVIRAAQEKLEIRQLAVELRPRAGRSKLAPLRDGWRHLRLIVVYSPNFLFLLPGAAMVLVGLSACALVLAGVAIAGRQLNVHTEIAGAALVTVGVDVIALGLVARTYGVYFMRQHDPFVEWLQGRVRLEHGLALGGGLVLAGAVSSAVVVGRWLAGGAGHLGQGKLAVVLATTTITGVQVFFASFLLWIIGLRRPRDLQEPSRRPRAPSAGRRTSAGRSSATFDRVP